MNKLCVRSLAPIALTAALAACGGADSGDPYPSPLGATVVITASSLPELNGTYTTTTVALNEVSKFNPIGGDPETCRFRFGGLQQVGTSRLMDGDIRYFPDSVEAQVTFIAINGVEYRIQGTQGVYVDKPGSEIEYNGATLLSTQGTGATLVLSGRIPMRGNRPHGC